MPKEYLLPPWCVGSEEKEDLEKNRGNSAIGVYQTIAKLRFQRAQSQFRAQFDSLGKIRLLLNDTVLLEGQLQNCYLQARHLMSGLICTHLQTPPPARQGHTAVWDGADSLIIVGGNNGDKLFQDVRRLSLSTGYWQASFQT